MTNARITEFLAPTAIIAPSSQSAGTATTTGHRLSLFRKRLYTLIVGAVGGGGSVTMKLQASPDGATGWVDVPGTTTTAITTANGIAQIEVAADRFAALNLGEFARASVTVAGAACFTCVLAQAGNPRFVPASDNAMTGTLDPIFV